MLKEGFSMHQEIRNLSQEQEIYEDAHELGLELTKKDIIEYTYVSQAAELLKDGAEALMGEGTEALSQNFRQKLEQYRAESKITEAQYNAFVRGISKFEEDTEALNTIIGTAEAEDIFPGLPKENILVGINELPGVVVVAAENEDAYGEILEYFELPPAKLADTALYSKTTHNIPEFLRGRIIILSDTATNKAIRHEYTHFLQHKYFLPEEVVPEVSIREKSERLEQINAEVEDLREEILEIELELEDMEDMPDPYLVRTLSEKTRQLKRLQDIEIVKENNRELRSKNTYKGLQQEVFQKGRNELTAYFWDATDVEKKQIKKGGIRQDAVRERSKDKTPQRIFGKYAKIVDEPDSLEMEVLQEDWLLFAKVLTELKFSREEKEELAPLIMASRNFEQMAKFIYLYKKQKQQ